MCCLGNRIYMLSSHTNACFSSLTWEWVYPFRPYEKRIRIPLEGIGHIEYQILINVLLFMCSVYTIQYPHSHTHTDWLLVPHWLGELLTFFEVISRYKFIHLSEILLQIESHLWYGVQTLWFILLTLHSHTHTHTNTHTH